MIKCSLGVFGSLYVRIFNKILDDGIFPRKWNEGYITPIFKAGETADPVSQGFRPPVISPPRGLIPRDLVPPGPNP